MSFFDTPANVAQNYDALNSLDPSTPESFTPGIFDGFGESLAKALPTVVGRGVLNAEEALTPAVTSFADYTNNKDLGDWATEQQAIYRKQAMQWFTPPENVGWAAKNLTYGVGIPLVEMLGTGLAGGLVGAGAYEGLTTYNVSKIQLEAQGMQPEDAEQLALGQGAVAGAMALIPGNVGLKALAPGQLLTRRFVADTARRIGTVQAVINTGAGVATRYATQQYLASKGYDAMAAAIHPFALSEMVTDAAMGGVLGYGFTRVLRTGLPASAVNSAGHGQVDLTSGVPIDVGATNTHAEALASEVEALLRGESEPMSGEATPAPANAQGGQGVLRAPKLQPPPGVRPEQAGPTLDDAMTVNSARHGQLDVAPGVPIDMEAANAHDDALMSATQALLRGDSVDVESRTNGAHFDPTPPDIVAAHAELGDEAAEIARELAHQADVERAASLGIPPDALAPVGARRSVESQPVASPAISEHLGRALPEAPAGESQLAGSNGAQAEEASTSRPYTDNAILDREGQRLAVSSRDAASRKLADDRVIDNAKREAFAPPSIDRTIAGAAHEPLSDASRPYSVFPGTVADPMPRDTLLAAGDARIAEAAKSEGAFAAAVQCFLSHTDL